MEPTVSPNGGSVRERRALEDRFRSRVAPNPALSRKAVSYQGNRAAPGLRWMKYKEGFSAALVDGFISEFRPMSVLDPFAGIGTAPLVAAGRGARAAGIEIMPVGALVGRGIAEAANGARRDSLESAASRLLAALESDTDAADCAFPHVRITESAFPPETEAAIAKARKFIQAMDESAERSLLDLACMTILEEVSYTRKDGQYLRWDYRSGRNLRSRVHKGRVAPFAEALGGRLYQMLNDMDDLKREYGGGHPEFRVGSCLEILREIPEASYDMVVTSPPYANRYDYTRTYALELAWLGYGQSDFSDLRQSMLSATVENKPKTEWLRKVYGEDDGLLLKALGMREQQGAVREVLEILTARASELGNRHVIRLIEGYFLEMAVVVAELGRIIRPGGFAIMVNDNVRYHGEEAPTDLILADYAERCGFVCESIWTLPRGKGNSSQQMRRFGRREIRKCVYKWRRSNDQPE